MNTYINYPTNQFALDAYHTATDNGKSLYNAIVALSYRVDGSGSKVDCDILNIVYEGDANGSFLKGDANEIVSMGGYAEYLIAIGISTYSHYKNLGNNF